MQDYLFGNRLAKLRKAKGYSQFQVAKMMGLTDKAISKWETGVSKPRASACAKLAGLLGVDVDQLMDNDLLTPDEIEQLVNRQSDLLWDRAEARMKELYGDEPPLPVLNRFILERNALHRSGVVILFDILARVNEAARQKHFGFATRGAVCFVSWLLGATEVNPLEPHLRCPKCRRTEFHPEVRSGWDLPEATCTCGSRMIPDGPGLPVETIFLGEGEPFGFFPCSVDEEFLPEAERIILGCGEQFFAMERYHEDGSEDFERGPEGRLLTDPETGKPVPIRTLPMSSLLFAPKKKAKIRRPERISGPAELVNWGIRSGQPVILLQGGFYEPAYLSKPTPFKSQPEDLVRQDVMERALRDYWENKQYEAEEISGMSFPDLSPYLGRLTFDTFVSLLCSVNNLYMADGPQELAEETGFSELTDVPSSIEDLWKVISSSVLYPGYMNGAAGEIIINTARGNYLCNDYQQGIGSREQRLFKAMGLPEWFTAYASNIMDLCFRRDCIDLGIRLLEDARRKIRDGQ